MKQDGERAPGRNDCAVPAPAAPTLLRSLFAEPRPPRT